MTLKITNFSKKHGNSWLFRDLSLEIGRGRILGIFGKAGSGKSTLLRSIAGTEGIDSGEIYFDSENVTLKSQDQRGFHILSLIDESIRNSPSVNETSLITPDGGSLALENALETAENLLLIDNQFCLTDPNLRESNFDKLREIVRKKMLAAVFATNDFEQIFSLCDEVSVLVNGRITQTGTPRSIYESPSSVEVAAITGRNNLIKARRISSDEADHPEFQTILGSHRLFTNKTEVKGTLAPPDQEVTLAIRPEHISISFGASFPEDNLLKARIKGIKYQGPTTLIRLDAQEMVLDALVLRLVGLKIGDECMVGLPPDRIQVLKD